MPDIPPAIARLQEFIERTLTGALVEHRFGESFGNMLYDYQLGINHVRIIRDRGEWRVECAFGSDEWHDLYFLRQALGHGEDLYTLSLDDQVEYAIDHLPAILSCATRDNRLIDTLRSIYAERSRR